MKHLFNILAPIALVFIATSCEKPSGEKYDEAVESALVGKWEYTIDISYSGTDYTTGLPVSGERTFKGTFTWDDYLHGLLGGDLEECYPYLEGSVDDGHLTFIEDSFTWSENDIEYEVFCDWQNTPVTKKTKEFSTKSAGYSWVEITYPNGNEIFTTDMTATLKAKKIN